MNEQQLQQIFTIQQAIAAAATAAVINSLFNPQQAAAGLTNPNANALTEALQNTQNHLDLQQQQNQPDCGQDSPIATSSSPAANNNQNDANKIQELLLQLQQQAALSGNANAASAAAAVAAAAAAATTTTAPTATTQQQQAALLAALNLNLNNANNLPLQQQLHSHLTGSSPLSQSPINSRLQLGQSELSLASPSTGSNNISNQSSPNKKLKNRHLQQPPTVPTFTPHSRSSLDATSKPQQHQSTTPKSHHSSLGNLGNKNNSCSNNSNAGSSPSFLPNNVGLPRKLVRGQDVWLGRGAEQTRQILKCMWCGQSFRTLAEMTQHMRETQHYTNIISQEQITSWRQPDGSEANSNKHHHSNKQSNHSTRIHNDHNQQQQQQQHSDDLSEKFNDSEDSFSNDDEPSPRQQRRGLSKSKHAPLPPIKREFLNNDPNSQESISAIQRLAPSPKPASRNRKRESEDSPKLVVKRGKSEANGSPSNLNNSSQQRVLSDLNENSEPIREKKIDLEDREDSSNNPTSTAAIGNSVEERAESSTPSVKSENVKQDGNQEARKTIGDASGEGGVSLNELDGSHDEGAEDDDKSNRDMSANRDDSDNGENQSEEREEEEEEDEVDGDEEDEENLSDSKAKRRSSKQFQTDITSAGSTKTPIALDGQKVDASGDPLSALETMVEKSFDPRMRPGMASGGILQRLGIDEEVCPPWQHINYANWYAAAAYGHPMAAALLAAGINLQNGIKLNKNLSSKKNDED